MPRKAEVIGRRNVETNRERRVEIYYLQQTRFDSIAA
jgi:hypothetical protein